MCLHQSGSVASIHNGGRAQVSGIRYTNIEAHTLAWPNYDNSRLARDKTWGFKLFEARIVSPSQFCRPSTGCLDPSARGAISNVSYTRLSLATNNVSWLFSRFLGNSSLHSVADLSFTDVIIDGQQAKMLKDINATTNSYVRGVRFKQLQLSIEDFGGVADGETNNHGAFVAAIAACAAAQGCSLTFPPVKGRSSTVYRTSSVSLTSFMTLIIPSSVTLRATETDRDNMNETF